MYRDFHDQHRGFHIEKTDIANIYLIAIISVCEWDGVRPIHCSIEVYPFHPKQSTKMLHDKRESHGNDVISPKKTCDIATFQPICRFKSWVNQNVIWGIISPNRGLTSHGVWLLDEVYLSSKIKQECWPWWISTEIWVSVIHWIDIQWKSRKAISNCTQLEYCMSSFIFVYIIYPCQISAYRYINTIILNHFIVVGHPSDLQQSSKLCFEAVPAFF